MEIDLQAAMIGFQAMDQSASWAPFVSERLRPMKVFMAIHVLSVESSKFIHSIYVSRKKLYIQ